MTRAISKIVIVGGGTAGWLTACLLAAEHGGEDGRRVQITLVESPDVPIIGVGEGTWPSMRSTLQRIGLHEDEMVSVCEASFKQGTTFYDWSGLADKNTYSHPFSAPIEYSTLNLAEYWLGTPKGRFDDFVTAQSRVIQAGLAPKQAATPPYAFAVNYAYHFDAGKFATLLHKHGIERLGIAHYSANVIGVNAAPNGDIEALKLDTHETLEGDLFVDCTGHRALLLSGHYGVPLRSVKQYLFNDRALAVQVPYPKSDQPIASTTHSTAKAAGWVWDIGLQTRRGVGYVYSSNHIDEAEADLTLRDYIKTVSEGTNVDELSIRSLSFEPAYREQFWVNNCVAVGLSAGFVEPLEASALALVEQSANLISRQLPVNRDVMDVVAKRFNSKMSYHWDRIIEFLKLHYVLSQRDDSQYWRDCRSEESCPESLKEKLMLWNQQSPWHDDAPLIDELFPSASYQFVLYGMGFIPQHACQPVGFHQNQARVDKALFEEQQRTNQLLAHLPGNRELINAILGRQMNQVS
jgi:tryptophan halogenase